MPNDNAFRRAILANPADLTTKLVYADWLQEHDDPVAAEFVRIQVELHTSRSVSAAVDAAAWFILRGSELDADWVAFIRKSFSR